MQAAVETPTKEKLIQKASDLKVLPMVAKKVMETVARDNASAMELSRIIEKDKALTSRVLKISNSAFYGLRNEVRSLQHAVAVLGFDAVRTLVVAASTKGLHKNFGITEQMMWEHSVGAAVAARILCRGKGRELQDFAFIGGLLHDVGKVIFNNVTPATYAEVLARVYNEGASAAEAEQAVYGYDHSDVGVGVLEKWGFPEPLCRVVEFHHRMDGALEAIGDPFITRAVAAVNLGDGICRFHGIGFRAPEPDIDLRGHESAEYLGVAAGNDLDAIVGEIKGAYEAERASFE